MFEQLVQPRRLRVFDFEDQIDLPLQLHVGVSKKMGVFLGESRLTEIENFIKYITNVLNLTSSCCKNPKQNIDVDITKRPVGTTYNGDCMNTPNGAFMRVFIVAEYGLEKAFRHVMETIAHEFIHLKQFAYGELSTQKGHDGFVRWNWEGGVLDQHKNFQEYLSFPWEQEAFHNQSKLVDGWRTRSIALSIHTNLL